MKPLAYSRCKPTGSDRFASHFQCSVAIDSGTFIRQCPAYLHNEQLSTSSTSQWKALTPAEGQSAISVPGPLKRWQ
jgi:hypothetical protein